LIHVYLDNEGVGGGDGVVGRGDGVVGGGDVVGTDAGNADV